MPDDIDEYLAHQGYAQPKPPTQAWLEAVEREKRERDGDTGNPKDRIGIKKPQLDLVPPALRVYAALAFKDGAAKYGPYNWRQNDVKASIYYAAVGRHLDAWFEGENYADDSGVPHLAHAAAGLAILIDALENDNLIDDRPPSGPTPKLIRDWTAS
jgi:hypothetical protein